MRHYQWFEPKGSLQSREIAYQFWSYLVRGLMADTKGGPGLTKADKG